MVFYDLPPPRPDDKGPRAVGMHCRWCNALCAHTGTALPPDRIQFACRTCGETFLTMLNDPKQPLHEFIAQVEATNRLGQPTDVSGANVVLPAHKRDDTK